jgi:hypothetical protein
MTPFPRIYSDQPCPLDGYEGYSFRVLLNPTGQEKTDWMQGNLGIEDCDDCAKLGTPRGKQASDAPQSKRYCARCQGLRAQLGRATVAVYGTSHAEGFDFSTPESALATFSQDDLPDELLRWLYMLPAALWVARVDDLKKKLPTSLASPT